MNSKNKIKWSNAQESCWRRTSAGMVSERLEEVKFEERLNEEEEPAMRKTIKTFFSSGKEDYEYKATKARINLDNSYDESYSSMSREKCRS